MLVCKNIDDTEISTRHYELKRLYTQ